MSIWNTIKEAFTPTTEEEHSTVITRIPPSPTGNLHVGTARTALFNYLFAKKFGGKMFLRLEDTDKERSKKEFEENIISGFKWLGITWDNTEVVRQSERTELYKTYLKKMIEDGTAYVSKETPKTLNQSSIKAEDGIQDEESDIKSQKKDVSIENKERREEVIRFRNPNKEITFNDKVRGDITFDTTDLGDFIIAKSLDEPLYHLAVVIDDHEMGITHVIRGDDGISNTPRQILIQEAIGATRPIYCHLPMVLGSDKKKLSKRHGAKSIVEFKEDEYLPEAILNYLAMLGWNPGTEQEVFTLEQLVSAFELGQVQKGGAIFNIEKLDWFNKEHIKMFTKEKLEKIVNEKLPSNYNLDITNKKDCKLLEKITPLIIERITNTKDIKNLVEEGEVTYFFEEPEYDVQKLLWKQSKDLQEMKEHLLYIQKALSQISDEVFNRDIIKESIWEYAGEKGRGNVLWPLRYALSGRDKSPDPFEIADIIGKEKTLTRIDKAIKKIG